MLEPVGPCGVKITMPYVTIRATLEGREETLSDYICDWPDCPNSAAEVVGVIRELRIRAAVCAEHAAILAKRKSKGPCR